MDKHEPIARAAEYGRRSMAQQRYVVFDVETTGLSPVYGDRVIEIGAIAVEKKQIAGEFHSLVNVGKRIPFPAHQIHGITNDMLTGQPLPEEAFPRFHAFVGDGILVAHNARFDVGFLKYEFSRLGLGLSNKYLCTLEMSRRRFPRLRNHKLETVYRHLFREPIGAIQQHRALDDARMVARVWMEMMKR